MALNLKICQPNFYSQIHQSTSNLLFLPLFTVVEGTLNLPNVGRCVASFERDCGPPPFDPFPWFLHM